MPPPPPPPAAEGSYHGLSGSPELPFSTRLSMTVAIHSRTATRLLLLVPLVCIVRVPSHHTQLHSIFRCYFAAILADLLWQRLFPASHARWRHALLPAFVLCDVLMSRHSVVRAGLDTSAAVPGGGVRDVLHHLLLLVLSSRFTTNLFLWGLCHPAKYMLPAQLAIVYHHWRANSESCAAEVLASPVGQEHTRVVAGMLSTLQLGGLTNEMLSRQLTSTEECRALLAWQQLMFGLTLPLLAQLTAESRLWLRHQAQRRRRGLPPERSRLAWLHHAVHAVDGIDAGHAAVLCLLLSAVLRLLAVAVSVDS